jgi:hypothetical protein
LEEKKTLAVTQIAWDSPFIFISQGQQPQDEDGTPEKRVEKIFSQMDKNQVSISCISGTNNDDLQRRIFLLIKLHFSFLCG